MIRSILSDLPRSNPETGTVLGASGSAVVADAGAVPLPPLGQALPLAVARAQNTGSFFSLVLARPGSAASAGSYVAPVTAGAVADLAASLSVSLGPSQELYAAGDGYLAVVVPGRGGASRREATRLARRANAEGAPMFAWAAAAYPRDGTTASALLATASNRLDGRLVSRTDFAAPREPERGVGRSGAAIWAGVAAAVLIGALAFALHGSKPATHPSIGSGVRAGGSATGSPSTNRQAAVGSLSGTGPGGAGGPAGGSTTGGRAGDPSGGGAGGSAPSGSSGTGTASDGTSSDTGSGSATSSSATTLPASTATTLPAAGSGGSVGTTTTTAVSSTTTTTAPCNGLVLSLTCTAGNVVKKLGL